MKAKSPWTYIILSAAIAIFWSAVAAALVVLAGAPAWIIPATFFVAFMGCIFGFSMCAIVPAEKP